jgi:hypothetical protein
MDLFNFAGGVLAGSLGTVAAIFIVILLVEAPEAKPSDRRLLLKQLLQILPQRVSDKA